jgi:CheY-like chemotaxis protein
MKKEVKIIIAEDDDGHAVLIKKNLKRAGVLNEIIRFKDGQETLNYLLRKNQKLMREQGFPHLLLLDIRMPKVDGIKAGKEGS